MINMCVFCEIFERETFRLKTFVCLSKIITFYQSFKGFQIAVVVKNPSANAENRRDAGSVPGLGRSLGEENGSPLQ